MAEMKDSNGNHAVLALSVADDDMHKPNDEYVSDDGCFVTLPFLQKVYSYSIV